MSSQHVHWLARARRLLAEHLGRQNLRANDLEIAVSQAPEESIHLLEAGCQAARS